MTLRFLRVEQALNLAAGLFDSSDDELWRAFNAAIAANLPEADDLDFKKEWWRRSEELAKDCTAFANGGGGVMVVGIDDGGRDMATTWAAFPKPAGLDERVQQSTASRTAPKLPLVRTRWVPDPGQVDTGIAVIAVPRSPSSPHAVAYNPGHLGYPVRRSGTTDWLSETEIADRYRNRFELARAEQDRAQTLCDTARPALDRAARIWVTVALVPSLPGRLSLTTEQVNDALSLTEAWQRELPLAPQLTHSFDGRVRRRRVVISTSGGFIVSQHQHHELWLDGSGFAAAVVGGGIEEPGRPWTRVDRADIEFVGLRLADLLVKHAVRAGASGDVILTAQLLPARDDDSLDSVVATPDYGRTGQPARIGVPLLIDQYRPPNDQEYAHARRIDAEPGQVTSSLIDIAESPRELVLAVRQLFLDTLAEDGVSSTVLLTDHGAISAMGVPSRRLREIQDWAAQRGLEYD